MDDASLVEVLSTMRDVDVCMECREEGLRIARGFHPSVIVAKYIQALGFGSAVGVSAGGGRASGDGNTGDNTK